MRFVFKKTVLGCPNIGTELTKEEILAIKPGIDIDAWVRNGIVEPTGVNLLQKQNVEIQALQVKITELEAQVKTTEQLEKVIAEQKKTIEEQEALLEEYMKKEQDDKIAATKTGKK